MSGRSAHSDNELLVSLSNCLFGGDAEQLARERRIRREALLVSILFQLAAVAMLVLVPLLYPSDLIAHAGTAPRAPYIFVSGPPAHGPTNDPPRRPRTQPPCTICAPRTVPPTVSMAPESPVRASDDGPPVIGVSPFVPDGFIPIISDHPRGPQPPFQPTQTSHPGRVVLSHLQPGMLLHRVEPIYPPICQQTGREGRVELHAIISTDGSIQSLQVVGGDPFFFRSALSAVRQWRYRPTTLGGVPVEVETEITVIYQMQR